MSEFVLFDSLSNEYLLAAFGKCVGNWIDAKRYKRFKCARTAASLMNVSRNVPAGIVANKHYQNMPNVEVHEYDEAGSLVHVHPAPPDYIRL